MESPTTKTEFRIDWCEIDPFGHVNNLAILRYVQTARVQYLENIGLMQSHSKTGIGPILASVTCQFCQPLFYPGMATVDSRVDLVKNTSFRIQHRICNDKNEICAEAQDIIVLYDFAKNTKVPLPQDMKRKMGAGEESTDP